MNSSTSSSRERLLAALACRPAEPVPCAFMMYKGLKNRCSSDLEFVQAQLDLGLDAVIELPVRPPVVHNDYYNLHGLPVTFSPQVHIKERRELLPDGRTLLLKDYHTPAGTLRTELLPPASWAFGDHIPFLDDTIIPAARKFPVTTSADLPALQYLLQPPTPQEVQACQEESRLHLHFARANGLLVTAGWGVGADLAGWVCGLKETLMLSYRQPDFLAQLLRLISDWNQSRMRALLTLPVDLYIKRAWYENCDFWTPASWRSFILPLLSEETALAHQAGARFGYILTSKAMPLIDDIIAAGVDVLIGVDPREYDLPVLAQKARGKLCLWGGVNGHLTVETGTPAQVQAEVERALRVLAPSGGLILSPVDNIRTLSPQIEANVSRQIAVWQAHSKS